MLMHSEAVGKLLDQYEDDATATWLYSHACSKAKAQPREALNRNRYVPRYILGGRDYHVVYQNMRVSVMKTRQ